MKLKRFRIISSAIFACCVLSLVATGNVAFAEERPTSSVTVSNNMNQHDIEVLSLVFSDKEIEAISQSATAAEIDELVMVIENPQLYVELKEKNAVETRSAPNGCSYSPDSWGKANFKPTCDRHDICYSRSSTTNRLTCDNTFRTGLKNECSRAYKGSNIKLKACNGVAEVYYQAVRKFGASHYEGRGRNN